MPSRLQIPLSPTFTADAAAPGGGFDVIGRRLCWWLWECHGFWHNFALILPSVSFVLYLALQAKKSCKKLSIGRSHIINSYYGIVWIVSLLNLAWCSLQVWECTPDKALAWNILSLFTTSGMLFLEVSLIAFLLQGNYLNGLEALARTFAVSAMIVGFDIVLKGIYVFGYGIPLFIENDDATHRVKFDLWAVHKLVLTIVYAVILFMYHSKWRERLPARPAFQKYIKVMLIINSLAIFASLLTGNGVGLGFWLYDITIICYHAVYLPLLYVTFLADFFQEEDLNLENVYYSEMKDAGFFEADWE
ncbi:hypothetical protein V2J09_008120 [Rumex salicifolius]